MTYEQDILEDIEKEAACGFSIIEISVILNLNLSDFIDDFNDPACPVKRYYEAGRLKSEMRVREQIVSLAESGSATAQVQFAKMMQATEIGNLIAQLNEY